MNMNQAPENVAGQVTAWRPCWMAVLAGEPTALQKAVDGKFATVANLRIKILGESDELDIAGIQLKLGEPQHERDRGFWLALPCSQPSKKDGRRFTYVQAKNGFFGRLKELAIKLALEGRLAKRFSKAEDGK